MASFKENFNRICREKGTTPTALCKKLGESTSKVSAWNNGSLPKEEMMLRLAQELNCSVMDFFADDISEHTIEPENDDETDILRIYRLLDRRAKHEFMTMVYEFESKAELQGDKTGTDSVVG